MTRNPPAKGDRIGEYVLDERLGEGGFGEVWKANHAFLPDKVVAAKIPASQETIEVLQKEGMIQHKLDVPSIVEPLGLDLDHDPPYLLMEFVEGEDLRKKIVRDAPFSLDLALRLSREILGPVRTAHQAGVVHADLKPENVLLPDSGGIKLADFGLGKVMEASRTAVLRSRTMRSEEVKEVAGTIAYMSPEQRDGQGTLDARTDLFAFGVMFFEMLTGELPVGSEVPTDVVRRLDSRVDAIYRKACARWDSRYVSVSELLRDLDRLRKPPEAEEVATPTPARRWQLKGGRLAIAAVLAGALLIFHRWGVVGQVAALGLGLAGAVLVFFSLGIFGRRPKEIEGLIGEMILFAFLVVVIFLVLVMLWP